MKITGIEAFQAVRINGTVKNSIVDVMGHSFNECPVGVIVDESILVPWTNIVQAKVEVEAEVKSEIKRSGKVS